MKKSLQISKLDAAKRQLETAIRLYFSNGDPVSMHTLTGAAYNVIRDITDKRSAGPMFVKDQLFEYIKPEFEKSLRTKINEAENFFKHADRDHGETLDFNPERTEMLIFDACSQYWKLSGEYPPLFKIYHVWFMANHPRVFTFSEEQARRLKTTASDIIFMGREGYFKKMLQLIMPIGA